MRIYGRDDKIYCSEYLHRRHLHERSLRRSRDDPTFKDDGGQFYQAIPRRPRVPQNAVEPHFTRSSVPRAGTMLRISDFYMLTDFFVQLSAQ